MKPPLCACGGQAEYSGCVLVSTIGVRPRRQKCGRAQLFCAGCMQRLLADQWKECSGGLQQSLRIAYTAIAEHSEAAPYPPAALGLDGEEHSLEMEQKEQTENFHL